ncbi:hypothetical protein K505DRAFT_359896 [Melanomma pulvis-pyrius CBS 109.77]|uniref:Uncharacterized protein n=1 Tax=Melanomma pulvis-pyrius CBS 109.77 TaxID=1314802 RepID=A0A6A6XGZ2_9PLEO|nr:hypothetical protein K505DRAFT_359896 [Melanomma pulvis-pyrius CBS 109.77]
MPVLSTRTSSSVENSPVPLALIITASICLFLMTTAILIAYTPIFPRLRALIRGEKTNAKNNPYTSAAHSKWTSPASSRTASPACSSKSQIFYPAADTETTFTKECSIQDAAISPSTSTTSIALPTRPESVVSPLECISYDSYTTVPSMDEVLHADVAVSPTVTRYSTARVQDAKELSFTLVKFPGITRTVDVRISNHTNPGSPIKYCKPESQW